MENHKTISHTHNMHLCMPTHTQYKPASTPHTHITLGNSCITTEGKLIGKFEGKFMYVHSEVNGVTQSYSQEKDAATLHTLQSSAQPGTPLAESTAERM